RGKLMGRMGSWALGERGRLGGAALVTAVAFALGAAAPAGAHPRTPARTPVTRAALDPALVAGRGAAVDFAEQEAENAETDGTVIGPDRSPYTLPAEASGRRAVRLQAGQHVAFT